MEKHAGFRKLSFLEKLERLRRVIRGHRAMGGGNVLLLGVNHLNHIGIQPARQGRFDDPWLGGKTIVQRLKGGRRYLCEEPNAN